MGSDYFRSLLDDRYAPSVPTPTAPAPEAPRLPSSLAELSSQVQARAAAAQTALDRLHAEDEEKAQQGLGQSLLYTGLQGLGNVLSSAKRYVVDPLARGNPAENLDILSQFAGPAPGAALSRLQLNGAGTPLENLPAERIAESGLFGEPSKDQSVLEAMGRKAFEFGAGMALDPSVALLGLSGTPALTAAQKAAGLVFTPQLAIGAGEELGEAGRQAGEGNLPGAAAAGLGAALSGGMATAIGTHLPNSLAELAPAELPAPRMVPREAPATEPPPGWKPRSREAGLRPEPPTETPPEPVAPEPRPESVAPEPQLAQEPPPAEPPPTERRAEPELREKVQQFIEDNPEASRDDLNNEIKRLRTELDTDPLTGLGSRRAFENAKAPIIGSFDVAGLKWINDNEGHIAGDQYLKAVGQAIRDQPDVKGFRVGGDEFFIHADTPEQAEAASQQIRDRLSQAKITLERPDGTQVQYTGARVDYGIGQDKSAADADLYSRRAEATARGERAPRGERPRGLVEIPAEGVEDRQRPVAAAEPAEAAAVPEGGALPAPRAAAPESEVQAAEPYSELGEPTPEDMAQTWDYLRNSVLPELKKGYADRPGMNRDDIFSSTKNVAGVSPVRAVWGGVGRMKLLDGLEDVAENGTQLRRLIQKGPEDRDADSMARQVWENLERQRLRYQQEAKDAEAASFNPEEIEAAPRQEMTPEQEAEANRYAVARPGQRGIPGVAEDIPQKPEKAPVPKQTSMFGGDMLQPTEANVPEGREARGPLFTQEERAQEQATKKRQSNLFAVASERMDQGRDGLVERVKSRFPGVPIKETDSGVEIPLKRGSLVINKANQLEFTMPDLEAGHGRDIASDVAQGRAEIVGRKRSVGPDVIVDIVDHNYLDHEVAHVFRDHFATPEENRIIEREFGKDQRKGVDEAFSDAYNDWALSQRAPKTPMERLFQRIKDFAHRVYDSMFNSKGGLFREIRRGEFLKRERTDLGPEPGGEKYAVGRTNGGIGPQDPEADKLGAYDYSVDRFRLMQSLGQKAKAPETFEENPYLQLRTFRSRQSEGARHVNEDVGEPIQHILHTNKITLDEAGRYLYAKHALEANPEYESRSGPGANSGMSTAEATKVVEAAKRSGRLPAYEQVSRLVRQLNDDVLKFRVDSGLNTPEQTKAWKKTWGDNWVPLRHGVDIEGEPIGTPPSGGRAGLRGKEVKTRGGAEQEAFNPLVAALDTAVRVYRRGEENRVWNSFSSMAKAAPEATRDVFEVTDSLPQQKVLDRSGEYVGFKDKGQQKYLQFKKPDYIKALASLNPGQADSIARGIQKFTRLNAALNTRWNPVFALVGNPILDVPEALINTGVEYGPKTAAGMMAELPMARRAAMLAIKGGEPANAAEREAVKQFQEYRRLGGPMGNFSLLRLPDRAEAMKLEVESGPKHAAVASFHSIRDAIGKTGEALEAMTRFALYRQLLSEGVSKPKAIMASRDVTVDFERAGLLGRDVSRYYAFFNAGIQGVDKMVRVIKSNPKAAAKVMAGLVTMGIAQDMMNRAFWGDQDKDGVPDWDEVPQYVKENNIVVGSAKFPLPRGWRFFQALGINLSQLGNKVVSPSVAAWNSVLALNSLLNPLGEGLGGKDVRKGLAVMATPTVGKPLMEIATNQTALGSPVRPEQPSMGPKKPESELHFKNVNVLAKAFTDALNRVTGGDKITPGGVSISPEDVEQLFAGYLGGAGHTAAQAASTVASAAEGKVPPARQVPVASRFIYQPYPTQDASLFYQNRDDVQQASLKRKAYLDAARKGDKTATEKAKELAPLASAQGSFDAIARTLSDLQKAKSAAEARNKDTAMLDASIQAAYRRANRVVAEARKRAGLPALSTTR